MITLRSPAASLWGWLLVKRLGVLHGRSAILHRIMNHAKHPQVTCATFLRRLTRFDGEFTEADRDFARWPDTQVLRACHTIKLRDHIFLALGLDQLKEVFFFCRGTCEAALAMALL